MTIKEAKKHKERIMTEADEIIMLRNRTKFNLQEIIYWCTKYPNLINSKKIIIKKVLQRTSSYKTIVNLWYKTPNNNLKRKMSRRLKKIIQQKKIRVNFDLLKKINIILNFIK